MDMPDGYKNFSKTKPMKLEHFAPVMEWWKNKQAINVDGFDKARKFTVKEIVDNNYNLDLCGFPHFEEEVLEPKATILNYQAKRTSLNDKIDKILADISTQLGIEL